MVVLDEIVVVPIIVVPQRELLQHHILGLNWPFPNISGVSKRDFFFVKVKIEHDVVKKIFDILLVVSASCIWVFAKDSSY